jgi:hypothetical protein
MPDTLLQWHLVRTFIESPEWQQIAEQYAVVMVPDGDLIASAAAFTRFFEVFVRRKLKMGQPSLCG